MRTVTLLVTLPAILAAALPPYVEQIAPGVWAGGYADDRKDANIAWYTAGSETVVIGEGDATAIAKLTGKPVAAAGRRPGLEEAAPGCYLLRASGVLFGGDLITNGPRAKILPDTAAWISQLDRLTQLPVKAVVPGHGSWGGPELIARQRRFVAELRRQVAYAIAMERPLASIQQEFLLPASYYTWMPYDTPAPEDIAAVHRELSAPQAPFHHGQRLDPTRKHALVLIGDRYHEPEHLEAGLRPAFDAVPGLEAHFTVDTRALTKENLAQVDLLVILRDGMVWPGGPQGPMRIWMTAEQEQAVKEFVHGGKAFLNLHNSMGLYPEGGEYLKLVGGRYIGHGPLERFHVEVTDPAHPIAQGLKTWFAADEQHTPPNDIPVQIFLRSRSHDGKVVANAGWTHEPGKGRVCHLAPGHTRDALHHPMFQLAMRNAVEWCLRRR
jgi:type 1 glutamine amidotransferase